MRVSAKRQPSAWPTGNEILAGRRSSLGQLEQSASRRPSTAHGKFGCAPPPPDSPGSSAPPLAGSPSKALIRAQSAFVGLRRSTMQQLRIEEEEDQDRDCSALLARTGTPLSRFNRQDEEMRRLTQALQTAARARAASKFALEEIHNDFNRDFGSGSGLRHPGEKLVVKLSLIHI